MKQHKRLENTKEMEEQVFPSQRGDTTGIEE